MSQNEWNTTEIQAWQSWPTSHPFPAQVAGHAARTVLDATADVPARVLHATLDHLVSKDGHDDDDDDDAAAKDDIAGDASPRPPRAGDASDFDEWATLARVLRVVPPSKVDAAKFLGLAKARGKPRRALTLLKFVASNALRDVAEVRHPSPQLAEFAASALARALHGYLVDADDAMKRRVFAYADRTLGDVRDASTAARD